MGRRHHAKLDPTTGKEEKHCDGEARRGGKSHRGAHDDGDDGERRGGRRGEGPGRRHEGGRKEAGEGLMTIALPWWWKGKSGVGKEEKVTHPTHARLFAEMRCS